MIKKIPVEAIAWFGAMGYFALYSPSAMAHITLCPLRNAGFDFCPGCGLGRSISYFLHGEIRQSLTAHPLGIFAVIVLSFRILQLSNQFIKTYGQSN